MLRERFVEMDSVAENPLCSGGIDSAVRRAHEELAARNEAWLRDQWLFSGMDWDHFVCAYEVHIGQARAVWEDGRLVFRQCMRLAPRNPAPPGDPS